MINEQQVKKYCREDLSLIENYAEAVAAEEKWECHHRMETHDRKGRPRKIHFSKAELIEYTVYYHRPAKELIFLTHAEHRRLHHTGENNHNYGKHLSTEHRQKLSEAHAGQTPWNKGKRLSDEHRQKLSESHSGFYGKRHTEATRKKLSEANTGENNPRGMLGKHHSDATKQKMRDTWERRRREKEKAAREEALP